ncbi:MAG: transposase [Gammaproteobacteria bacterium]|jgi:IS30 family transposase|nr:transposase [Gammaproteobacteria bacterium]
MSRKRFGHWEGDLIEFSGTKQKTVTTLVERKSRIVILLKNDNKSSKPVINKIKEKLMPLPDQMCQSITFDQGSEFAQYGELERELNCKVYYCHVQSPGQKGSNENMNGRLRRYLPRTASVEAITQLQLDELAAKMNPPLESVSALKRHRSCLFSSIKMTVALGARAHLLPSPAMFARNK